MRVVRVPEACGGRAMSIRSSDGMEQPLLSNRDYRAVFEASPDAMLIVDPGGLIRDLNPQALTMFGWSREEMEGSGVEMLVPDASRSRHERYRQHYADEPRPRPMGQGLELQALRKDGTTFPVEISLSPGELASGPETRDLHDPRHLGVATDAVAVPNQGDGGRG